MQEEAKQYLQLGYNIHPLVGKVPRGPWKDRQLESGDLLEDRVNISAQGDVYIRELTGDLHLEKISANGAVQVEVMSGSILDANDNEERDERSRDDLVAGVWSSRSP